MGTSLSFSIRGAALAASTIAIALLWSAPAYGIGLDNLVAEPADTQAGANSDLHVHMELTDASDDLKDVTLQLPPGLAGNPQVPAKCTLASFNADTCDSTHPTSAIGATTVNVTALGLLPLDVAGTVYNLAPDPGEPARLGIVLRPLGGILGKMFTPVRVELRPGDLGLNSIITDLPNTNSGLPIDINSIDLVLDESFASNPTSCDEAVTTFVVRSYAEPMTDVTGQASFTPTGCENQAYDPAASLTIDAGASFDTSQSERPAVTTIVEQGPGEANTEAVELTMPSGLTATLPPGFTGVCSDSDFAAGSCPATTRIGSAVAESPLLAGVLSGSAFLVQGALLPDIGIDLQGDLDIQLRVQAGVTDGRVRSVLSGLPDLPLSKFTLSFPSGGMFAAAPSVCDPSARLDAVFDSHGGQHLESSVVPTVLGCGATSGGSGDGGGVKRGPRCGGRVATIVGTPGRDRLRGTRRADVIVGLGGRDLIRGRGGRDIICGRKGNDRLFGGRGNDLLIGGKGRDKLFGGPGRDRLKGGRGRDLERQ